MSPDPAGRAEPRVGPGAYVDPAATLEHGVVIEPNAVILSGLDDEMTTIEHGAMVGANATVLAGLTVGFEAVVQPGSVVTMSVPPRAIAGGNPARITGYVDADPSPPVLTSSQHGRQPPVGSRVAGVTLTELATGIDMRGSLAVGEVSRDVPFTPQRWFTVYSVPSVETRGQHAHKRCEQVLVAVAGSLRVVVDDGREREELVLDRRTSALYMPAMIWGIQYGFSPDAVLLVLASEPYDPDDYIRDYAEFLELARGERGGG